MFSTRTVHLCGVCPGTCKWNTYVCTIVAGQWPITQGPWVSGHCLNILCPLECRFRNLSVEKERRGTELSWSVANGCVHIVFADVDTASARRLPLCLCFHPRATSRAPVCLQMATVTPQRDPYRLQKQALVL